MNQYNLQQSNRQEKKGDSRILQLALITVIIICTCILIVRNINKQSIFQMADRGDIYKDIKVGMLVFPNEDSEFKKEIQDMVCRFGKLNRHFSEQICELSEDGCNQGIANLIKAGCNYIICQKADYDLAVFRATQQYPEVEFFIKDGSAADETYQQNYHSYSTENISLLYHFIQQKCGDDNAPIPRFSFEYTEGGSIVECREYDASGNLVRSTKFESVVSMKTENGERIVEKEASDGLSLTRNYHYSDTREDYSLVKLYENGENTQLIHVDKNGNVVRYWTFIRKNGEISEEILYAPDGACLSYSLHEKQRILTYSNQKLTQIYFKGRDSDMQKYYNKNGSPVFKRLFD